MRHVDKIMKSQYEKRKEFERRLSEIIKKHWDSELKNLNILYDAGKSNHRTT